MLNQAVPAGGLKIIAFKLWWILSSMLNLVISSPFDFYQSEENKSPFKVVVTVSLRQEYDEAWVIRKKNPSRSKQLAQHVLNSSMKIGFSWGVAFSSSLLGYHAKNQQKFFQAEKFYTISLNERKKIGAPDDIAGTYFNLGKLYNSWAKYRKADSVFQKALGLLKEEPERGVIQLKAKILNSLGTTYRHMEAFDEAIKSFNQCLDIRQELLRRLHRQSDSMNLAKVLFNLGNIYLHIDKVENARRYYQKCLPMYLRSENLLDKGIIFQNLGLVALKSNKLDSAFELTNRAIELYQEDGDSLRIAEAMLNLGQIFVKKGNIPAAEKLNQKALDYFRKKDHREGIAWGCHNLGLSYQSRGELRLATVYFEEGLIYARQMPAIFLTIELVKALSDTYSLLEEYDKASSYAQLIIGIKDSINDQLLEAVMLGHELENSRAESMLLKQKEATLKAKLAKTSLRTRMMTIILIILFFLLIITIFLLLQRRKLFRAEKEKNRQRGKLLDSERERNQALLKAEQNAKKIKELLSKQEYKLLVAMNEGQEEERKRIAEELHDSLGTLLATIKLYYQSIEKGVIPPSPRQELQMNKLGSLMDEAISEVRRISHNLVSGVLWKFGLPPALADLRDTILMTGSVEFDLNTFGFQDTKRLDFKLELTIYRIIQELVTNALRHADASKIAVQVTKNGYLINLMVMDNGIGFEYERIRDGSGIGLKNIAARVAELDGTINIDSGKGNGTTINIDLPIQSEYEKEN